MANDTSLIPSTLLIVQFNGIFMRPHYAHITVELAKHELAIMIEGFGFVEDL